MDSLDLFFSSNAYIAHSYRKSMRILSIVIGSHTQTLSVKFKFLTTNLFVESEQVYSSVKFKFFTTNLFVGSEQVYSIVVSVWLLDSTIVHNLLSFFLFFFSTWALKFSILALIF